MRVTIETASWLPIDDDGEAGQLAHDIRIVLMDALAEYVSNRANGHGQTYVDKRYPGDSVYSGQSRNAKVQSVNRRCKLAQALHNGTMEVTSHD